MYERCFRDNIPEMYLIRMSISYTLCGGQSVDPFLIPNFPPPVTPECLQGFFFPWNLYHTEDGPYE